MASPTLERYAAAFLTMNVSVKGCTMDEAGLGFEAYLCQLHTQPEVRQLDILDTLAELSHRRGYIPERTFDPVTGSRGGASPSTSSPAHIATRLEATRGAVMCECLQRGVLDAIVHQATAPPTPGRGPVLRSGCVMVLCCNVQDAFMHLNNAAMIPKAALPTARAYAARLEAALNARALLGTLLDFAVAQEPRGLPLDYLHWYAALLIAVASRDGTVLCRDARLVNFLVAALVERGAETSTGSLMSPGDGDPLAMCALPLLSPSVSERFLCLIARLRARVYTCVADRFAATPWTRVPCWLSTQLLTSTRSQVWAGSII